MVNLFASHSPSGLGLVAVWGDLVALLITACRASKEPSGNLRARKRYSASLYALILMPVFEMMPVTFELKHKSTLQQSIAAGAGLKPDHFIGLDGMLLASCVAVTMILCAFVIGPQRLWRFSIVLLAGIAAIGFAWDLEWSRTGSTYTATGANCAWWLVLPGAFVLLVAAVVKTVVVLRKAVPMWRASRPSRTTKADDN